MNVSPARVVLAGIGLLVIAWIALKAANLAYFDKAETHFEMAARLAPGEPNPHDLLGDVHRAQNNFEAAYNDYSKCIELAPDLGSGYQQRGHVNSFLGNYEEARADYSRSAELEDARGASLGGNRIQLVGVTDFLDAEGLLASHQRAEFTAPESVNATGELAEGRKVVVKGLYITTVDPHRINLTSLFSLADTCG